MTCSLGLGKTVQAIALDLERRKRWPDYIDKTLVVAPLSVLKSWERHFEEWSDLPVLRIDHKNRKPFVDSMFGNDYDVYICHWEALRLMPELMKVRWGHIIADECLLSGTLIDTPMGSKRIEDLKTGDTVYGYNHLTCSVTETKVLTTFNRCTNNDLFDVNGIIMTGNHPVWTNESKYVDASTLDVVQYTGIRLEYDQATKRTKEHYCNQDLRVVQEGIRSRKISSKQTSFLQHNMFEHLERTSLPQGTSEEYNRRSSRCLAAKHGTCTPESEASIIPQIGSEPYKGPKRACESAVGFGQTWISTSFWRNGKDIITPSNVIFNAWAELDFRTSSANGSRSWTPLCNRYCQCRKDDSSRSRWQHTYGTISPKEGWRERYIPPIDWLEGIEIHESRGNEQHGSLCEQGTRVYNIETTTGNFFANGLLVHNCHKLQNRKSKQSRALKALRTVFKTGLSGTPAYDKPDDLWSILNWLYPTHWSSFWAYFDRHILWENYNGYKTIIGVTNQEELQEQMRGFYIRRKKEDVLHDLPDKYYDTRYVDLAPQQRRVYNQMRDEMLAWIGEHETEPVNASIAIAQLLRLQQFACAYAEFDVDGKISLTDPSTKIDAVLDIILSTDKSIVVFSQFEKVIRLLGKRMMEYGISHGLYTGGVRKVGQRDQIIDDFQDGKIQVFAGTIGAGGIGIELTSADTCVFIDRDWSHSKNRQAEDRLHRIGQKNAVQIIDIHAMGTLDTKKKEILEWKWDIVKKLIGDDDD